MDCNNNGVELNEYLRPVSLEVLVAVAASNSQTISSSCRFRRFATLPADHNHRTHFAERSGLLELFTLSRQPVGTGKLCSESPSPSLRIDLRAFGGEACEFGTLM